MKGQDNTKYLDYDFLNHIDEKDTRIEFSLLSGYNFYKLPKKCEMNHSFLGTHIQSKVLVRVTPIGKRNEPITKDCIVWHQNFIFKPMSQEHFEWPIDLIEYINEESKYIQCYVFPLKAYPAFVPIKTLLYQEKNSKVLDWRNKEIQDICKNILAVFSLLHKDGYCYNNFDINRIFYEQSSKCVFLRHTLCIREKESTELLDEIDTDDISKEFAPPYIYKSEKYFGNIDEYSICCLLFRLMIGRLPYEGKGLTSFGEVFDPIRDVDVDAHQYYFQHYHQYPLFIFDANDASNSLGPMSENDLPRERWHELPDKIKDMFQNSLGNMEDVLENNVKLYSPEEWKNELERWCWS